MELSVLRIGIGKEIKIIAKPVVKIEPSERCSSCKVKRKAKGKPPGKKFILQLV
jgi:hypothetical protein